MKIKLFDKFKSLINSNTETPADAYQLAELFSTSTNRCMFITGKAGTGKTTFLKQLREHTLKNMAVVAPTGVAAINAGGVTIHSFFQLPIRTIQPTPQSYKQMFAEQRMQSYKRDMLYHLELLVIDEISMVRADVLDAIDAVLRHYKYRYNQPFGGVQVIMIGDLFQLSPVIKNDEIHTMAEYYAGPYFFQSKVMQSIQPVYIELDHVFRQQNADFVRVLNEVRENRLSDESRQLLNTRYLPDYKNSDTDFHITLTTHNQTANDINQTELDKLSGALFTAKARIEGTFTESNYPTEEELNFKIGARVMFIRNDEEHPRRFYNGKMGIIAGYDKKQGIIKVECDDGPIMVGPITWENIRYQEEPLTGKITQEVLGTFTQFPLRLAWAVTIHKSQGLTFDNVIIDAARAFASGQVYVALSRCRTLEGIVLTTSLDRVRLNNDRQVINYTNQQPSLELISKSLDAAKAEYLLQILCDLYDFRRITNLANQMAEITEDSVSFNEPTQTYLEHLHEQIGELINGNSAFQNQLTQIILSKDINTVFLRKRLKDASKYYCPLIDKIIINLRAIPCRSKNKDEAAEFYRLLLELYGELYIKMKTIEEIPDEPSADKILTIRNSINVPNFPLDTLMEKSQKKKKVGYEDDEDVYTDVKPSKATNKPANAAAKWTREEDELLFKLFNRGYTVKELSDMFQRSGNSINSRLKKLGLK